MSLKRPERIRSFGPPPYAELLQAVEVTFDQCCLFCVAAAFELALSANRLRSCVALLGVGESDGVSVADVVGCSAGVVLSEALGEVAGLADVEGAVGAGEDVDGARHALQGRYLAVCAD